MAIGLTPPFKDEDLAGILRNLIHEAGDFAQDFLEENRRNAWNYYFGRIEGQTDDVSPTTDRGGYTRILNERATSNDVGDMVEALMATLMPSFGSDVPAEFEPIGPDDEEQASAESDAVANVLMEQNQGWTVIAEAIKDALLLRNGTIKCWIEESVRTQRRRIKDVDDQQIAEFLASVPEGIEARVTSRKGDDVNITLTEIRRVPKVKAIQQAHMLLDPNHDNIDISDISFVAERMFLTRSELLDMGVSRKKVDLLPTFSMDTDIDSTAKNIEGLSSVIKAATRDAEVIEVHECHLRIDTTGDGRSQLMKYLWSNDFLLQSEPALMIPYASGTGWLVPHRYSGLSVYDKLRQVADIKSAVLQTYLANLVTNNTARTAVNENTVNLDDLLAGRPNAVLRNDGPPGDDMMAFPINDTGASSQSLLAYMDSVRDQRAGAALSLQMPQDQLVKAGISAQSVERQMGASEQMAAMIARTLAETLIRQTFLLLHETLRTQFPEQIMLNRSGQWIPTNPQQWPQRNRVNVKVGLSPAERSRKAQSLLVVVQQQMALMSQGGTGIIVDLNGLHRAMLDWAKSVELDNAEKYWIDPESQSSQQNQQAQQQRAEAQEKLQIGAVTAEAAAANKNSERDFTIDQAKLMLEYFKSILDAEVEEAKIIGQGTIELDKLQAQGAERAQTNGDGGGAAES